MGIKAIILAVVALAVVGGGAYYVTSSNDDKSQQSSNSQSAEEDDKLTSIKNLIEEGKNVQCNFNSTEANGDEISGTVYVADERMRGNFSFTRGDQPEQKSNILQDGTSQYIWEEGSNEGFKTEISAMEDASETEDNAQDQQAVDQDRDYDLIVQNGLLTSLCLARRKT